MNIVNKKGEPLVYGLGANKSMKFILNVDLEEIERLEKEYNDSIDVVINIPNKGYFECIHDAYTDMEVNDYMISKEIKELDNKALFAALNGDIVQEIKYETKKNELIKQMNRRKSARYK